jgi:hypothetical protein
MLQAFRVMSPNAGLPDLRFCAMENSRWQDSHLLSHRSERRISTASTSACLKEDDEMRIGLAGNAPAFSCPPDRRLRLSAPSPFASRSRRQDSHLLSETSRVPISTASTSPRSLKGKMEAMGLAPTSRCLQGSIAPVAHALPSQKEKWQAARESNPLSTRFGVSPRYPLADSLHTNTSFHCLW